MNYRRAAIAGGAGFAALLIISATIAVVLAISYGLAAKYLFGGGPRYDEILALTVLPAVIGAGGSLLTLALAGGWLRALASAATGFILVLITVLRELSIDTYSTGSEARSMALALLLAATISVLIAIIRRPDIAFSRVIIVAFVIASVVVLVVAATIVSEQSVSASVTIALIAWIVPPAFAGLSVGR